ncbi:flagellar assembly protein FliH [Terrilactibacillus sp. S3-3]|nr:flagellar assembly protein FliH [Terrilactibacillus sp. S3-3]
MSNLLKSMQPKGEKKLIQLTAVIDPYLNQLNSGMSEEAVEASLTAKVEAAKQEAQAILNKAQNEYKEMQNRMREQEEAAQKKREQIYKQKAAEGFEKGLTEGKEEGRRSFTSKVEQANSVIDKASRVYKDYLAQAEPAILALSMKVAEKNHCTSLRENKDKWLSLVKTALKDVRDQRTIKITVPPAWFGALTDHYSELAAFVQDAKLLIYADGDLNDNDCSIETPFGKIDAGVDSQLAVIKAKLSELMEEQAGESHSVD